MDEGSDASEKCLYGGSVVEPLASRDKGMLAESQPQQILTECQASVIKSRCRVLLQRKDRDEKGERSEERRV
jgi:hypothetical protein